MTPSKNVYHIKYNAQLLGKFYSYGKIALDMSLSVNRVHGFGL